MNKKTLSFLFVVCFQVNVLMVYAVKASPHPMNIKQPDGTDLTIFIEGDEYSHIKKTEDGYVIKKNKKGFYNYAIIDTNGNISESKIRAKNISSRTASDNHFLKFVHRNSVLSQPDVPKMRKSNTLNKTRVQKAFPNTGAQKSIIILVSFSDRDFITPLPQNAFSNLLNQEGYNENGAIGSARDYFMASSYGKFAPNFDVVGPYQLPHTMEYYGKDNRYNSDTLAVNMVADACTAANPYVDFSQYDANYDGRIDNVFIIYAGFNQAEGGPDYTIWPQHSIIQSHFNYSGTTASITFDGKLAYEYACTSELRGNSGNNMCGIGTFVHEFVHVLGLPDYFHTSSKINQAQKATLGLWSIMDAGAYCNGGKTPPVFSTYDRFYLGWIQPEEITTMSDLTIQPISQETSLVSNTMHQSYLLSENEHNLNGKNPDPCEFFILEYRKKIGWDAFLPDEGLCIWHINYDKTDWDYNGPNNYTGTTQTASSHMRVFLESPTVLNAPATPPTSAFTSGSFTPTTWAGININKPLTSLVKTPESITLKVLVPSITARTVVADALLFVETPLSATLTKEINIKTTEITSNLQITLAGTNASQFTVSATTISQENANAAAGESIIIQYKPTTTGIHTAVLTISGGGLIPEKVITLKGKSTL